jgi:DNA-binding NtrC family response regulator
MVDKKTIIIADDRDDIIDFFKEFFRNGYGNYNLEFYRNGKEVDQRFLKGFEGVKLVILDNVMDPGLRGLELIKKYSGIAKSAGCKMILTTGEGLEEEAIKNGAFAYINKESFWNVNQLEKIINPALKN